MPTFSLSFTRKRIQAIPHGSIINTHYIFMVFENVLRRLFENVFENSVSFSRFVLIDKSDSFNKYFKIARKLNAILTL